MIGPLTRDAFLYLGEGLRVRDLERVPDGPRHRAAAQELEALGFLEYARPFKGGPLMQRITTAGLVYWTGARSVARAG